MYLAENLADSDRAHMEAVVAACQKTGDSSWEADYTSLASRTRDIFPLPRQLFFGITTV